MAWLLAPISTQADSLSTESGGQSRSTLKVSLQAGSPSVTVSVSITVPGCAQVRVGFCAEALESVPELVVQWKEMGLGPESGSSAVLLMAIVLPTGGAALTALTAGQMLIVPSTRTLPVVWARLHEIATWTAVV